VLRPKTKARYVVIHQADAAEAARLNAESRARAAALGKTLPAAARPFRTLREWRRVLAKTGGGLHDPLTGKQRAVPLTALAGADPDGTWLRIGFATGHAPYASYTVHGDVLLVPVASTAAQEA
jgi:hypothetical protein